MYTVCYTMKRRLMSVDSNTGIEERYDIMEAVHCVITQVLLLHITWIFQQDPNCDRDWKDMLAITYSTMVLSG